METPRHHEGASRDDADFELLEQYLDGELTGPELKRLETRLLSEPELSAALGRMNDDYAVRGAVWRSMEPAETVAEQMTFTVAQVARRQDLLRRAFRFMRVGAAVAACAVCFLAGWIGRGTAATAQVSGANAMPSGDDAAYVYQVALTDQAGNITAVQKFESLEDARAFAADVGKWQAREQWTDRGHPVKRLGL